MGFFDSFKKVVNAAASPPPLAPEPVQVHAEEQSSEDADDGDATKFHPGSEALDVAGFDVEGDEDGFFRAVQHMESEGLMGGTDESRAEIMAMYELRDRAHWQDVKDAVYEALVEKHGSMDEVMQRETNYRQTVTQSYMQDQISAKASSGEMSPVEGVSLDAWAAANAAMIQGANLEDLLRGMGLSPTRWDLARTEWEARMSRDTTFAIAQVYGAAFQNASKGKYGDLAREATAARAGNRELALHPPMSVEAYYEILWEQACAAKQGQDPTAALKGMGLSVVDWTDLSAFMGYHIQRSFYGVNKGKLGVLLEQVKAKVEAKHPGVTADVDIDF
jgi:hypothetical protein